MYWLWVLIVGAVIGAVAGAIANKGDSKGCIFNIIAGLLGSTVGQKLFGDWGFRLGGMAVIPSILGAVIVVAVVSLFMNNK
ncbi:GlsB/YeaQ/YmgE family stress response membrane protein [Vagococcus vulneris]|uniref:GlsB/YeaQ/YmgE family stress response membrane protein n=1 Tax=Vagococcus vulneris TaxID=1977869 RepID=A0A429ZZ89_9ENTE|nr:GlsB/YeaQ/YmgE family stress response membrane protein [Vagococcus vulneris]RST99325.1 GlsB/YeaQ/YmgE family stress response membrane protein [Vagococcus vulneris]